MAKGRSVRKKTTIIRIITENGLSNGDQLLRILLRIPLEMLDRDETIKRPVPSFSIDRITVDGFGPHGGPNILELKDGLTLLTGDNGTGKTHLLLAVHWCLFGERGSLDPWLSEADPLGKDLVNWDRIADGDHSMSVEVDFEWGGDHYTASRELKDGSEGLTIQGPSGTLAVDNVSPIGLTPDILPYLIFQGEAVMFLASEDAFLREGNLKDVISALSGAGDLSRYLEIMEQTRMLLFERSKNLREEVEPKEKELNSLGSRLRAIDERIRTLKNEISDMSDRRKKAITDYRKALKELSKIGAVTKDEEERALAKARAPIVRERFQDMLSGAGREILRGMTERALSQCIREKEERINRRMMYGALESQTSIVRNITETGKCLCGTSIGRTGMGREKIKALLLRLEKRRDKLKELGEEPIWTSDQVLEGVRMCLASRSFDRDRYLSVIKEIEETNWTLRKTDEEQTSGKIEGLISNIREFERITVLLERDKDDLGRLYRERKAIETKMKKIENELVKLWGVEEGGIGISGRLEKIEKGMEDLTSNMNDLMKEMRKDIEERANATMRKLDPEGRFGRIRIHPSTYRLGREIEKEEGIRTLPMAYLSAGERELMALSVLSSIPGISEGILMLDSPFPYIDSSRRSRIIERLPMISKRVFISLPEGTLADDDIEKADKVWSEQGSSLRRYRLEMRPGGSILVELRGDER